MDVEELRAQLKASNEREIKARDQLSDAVRETKLLESVLMKELWNISLGSIVRETRGDYRRGVVKRIRIWCEDEKPDVSVAIIKKDRTQGVATAHFYKHWEVEDGK